MSRIGKQSIPIPEGVEVLVSESNVSVKGPRGELSRNFHSTVAIVKDNGVLTVRPKETSRESSAIWGLSRALLFNMVKGVTEGYSKRLEMQGVGYRAQIVGENLLLSIGFSHQVNFAIPSGIQIKVEGNAMEISGIDKYLVGQTAARIRALRKPEPYKGKGIRYQGEHVRRKVGKKVASTTTK